MKMLYKYPQAAFPYADLLEQNRRRGHDQGEYELLDSGFFFDYLHLPDDSLLPLHVRSLVGLMPLLAVETLDAELLQEMPDFSRRMNWLLNNRPHLTGNLLCSVDESSASLQHIIGIVPPKGCSAFCRSCSMSRNFYLPSAFAPCPRPTASLIKSTSPDKPLPLITSPPNRPAPSLAATPIGAAPSGFRSTFCL